jgi:hypothetical protein
VGSLTSHNPIDLQGLLRGWLYFYFIEKHVIVICGISGGIGVLPGSVPINVVCATVIVAIILSVPLNNTWGKVLLTQKSCFVLHNFVLELAYKIKLKSQFLSVRRY